MRLSCLICNKSFECVHPDCKFCSTRCYGKAQRRPAKLACAECGEQFTQYRPQNKFCSGRCRSRAFARKQALLIAEALEMRADTLKAKARAGSAPVEATIE
jgi:hypothetical protein